MLHSSLLLITRRSFRVAMQSGLSLPSVAPLIAKTERKERRKTRLERRRLSRLRRQTRSQGGKKP